MRLNELQRRLHRAQNLRVYMDDRKPVVVYNSKSAEAVKTSRKELDYLDKHYPRIARNIELLWDTSQCLEYVTSLLVLDKDDIQKRQGFTFEAANALLSIKDFHSKYERPDIWRG